MIDLEPGAGGQEALPTNRFRTGDVVRLIPHVARGRGGGNSKSQEQQSSQDKDDSTLMEWRAIVHRIDEYKITLVLGGKQKHSSNSQDTDEDADLDPSQPGVPSDVLRYRVDRMADDVSYERMLQALSRVKALGSSAPSVIRVLLQEQKPSFEVIPEKQVQYYNSGLNAPQREAICFALGAQEGISVLRTF
jgi:hypothetical protein